MTQKIICRVCWGATQVQHFQAAVNAHLLEGWTCRDLSIMPRWLRCFVCIALLESEPLPTVRKA